MSHWRVGNPDIEAREYVVRDLGDKEPDLGIQAYHPSEIKDLKYNGIGYEWTEASAEIEERIDLEEHVGEHVATVLVDASVRGFERRINWHVDDVEPDGILDRFRRLVA